MPPSLRPLLTLVPLIVAASVLNYLNSAYVPALLLGILASKHWLFPPLLRPLSKPEATTRLKFNLFVLLHLAILILVFPPYISIKRGIVWYVDEYLQGRRGGQKSWAVAGVQAAEWTIALVALWNVIEATMAIKYPAPLPPIAKGRISLSSTRVSSPITRAYTPDSTPVKDPNAVRYRQQSQSPSSSPYSSTPNRLFAPRQESPLKHQSTSLVSSQLGNNIGPSGTSRTDDFVMVDRSEREWVDNIRKSVRGKGGTLGR